MTKQLSEEEIAAGWIAHDGDVFSPSLPTDTLVSFMFNSGNYTAPGYFQMHAMDWEVIAAYRIFEPVRPNPRIAELESENARLREALERIYAKDSYIDATLNSDNPDGVSNRPVRVGDLGQIARAALNPTGASNGNGH